ncbi:hypothetical protein [Mariniblastus fucicola]|uniref:Uncharacterized protein n=1 Tax=Mariniblastus fucicola TaxID=980251 RepID=A0A5B9PBR0_9BACT|nr:hypothetical protein [Mariniblastus fucicola]QEG22480.1 hypothetical protein MFFC18_23600 [Mariniblastus fucicola]
MTQKVESPAELHADHRHWQSDISMWKFDIQEWRSEHESALEQIEQIAELIRLHQKALNDHADTVEAIEGGLEFHEQNLAASLRDHADSDLDDALLGGHAEESKKFESQRKAHERIKKHHHVAMAHVTALKHSLEAAM